MTSAEARERAKDVVNTYYNNGDDESQLVELVTVLLLCVEFEGYERGISDAQNIVRAQRNALKDKINAHNR